MASSVNLLEDLHILDPEDLITAGVREIPRWILTVVLSFAILSSCYVIFTYYFFRTERNMRRRMLAWVAFCDLGAAVSVLLPWNGEFAGLESGLCELQALLHMFFNLSSLLWMAAVASNAHFVLKNSGVEGIVSKRGKECKYHGIVWPLSLACVGSVQFLYTDPFPEARERFELGCFIRNENMLAQSVNYGIPIAIAVHFFACHYYFFNELAASKARAIPLGASRGTGHTLRAEDLKLLGASSQRMVKHNMRVAVTLRQYLLVLAFCHGWQLTEIFLRTTVQNRLVEWLYFARVISLPLKATLSAVVFESRGKFMSKYCNRMTRKISKKHQTLQSSNMMYSSANMASRMLTTGLEQGATGLLQAGQKTTSMLMSQSNMINSQDSDMEGLAAEMRQFALGLQNRTVGVAHRTHGAVVYWILRIGRQSVKWIALPLLLPIALTAWIPLYFLDEFVIQWRRRSGLAELHHMRIYFYSLIYFVLLVTPGVVFSRVVTNNIGADNAGNILSKLVYTYLVIPIAFVIYCFWINRYDPAMATVPDPRSKNRVRGNCFEGCTGYGILVYEFVAFNSMSYLSNQVMSRLNGDLDLTEAMYIDFDKNITAWPGAAEWKVTHMQTNEGGTSGTIISDVFLNFFNNSSYYIQFYSMYSLVVVWMLMWTLPMVVKIMWNQRISDLLLETSLGPISWSFTQFLLSDLFFLAIARGLLSAIDCSENDLGLPGGATFTELDALRNADDAITCWHKEHLWYVIPAVVGLYLFLPTATLGKRAVYTPGQDMRWIPLWVRVDLFARSLLLLIVIHNDSNRLAGVLSNVGALMIHVAVLWCNNTMRPCCVFWVNWVKMIIHTCACWSTIVALSVIIADIRSMTIVAVANVAGWASILVVYKLTQRRFILIEHAMRTTDRFSDEMKDLCFKRIAALESLLTQDQSTGVAQWSHHSLILELICFCHEVNQEDIMQRAFEAMARISVHQNAVAFMERCPVKSTVQLLSTAVTPHQHPFRRLVNTLKLLERDLGGGLEFRKSLQQLLAVVDLRMKDSQGEINPELMSPLGKWATPEDCLIQCGFELHFDSTVTIAEIGKLRALLRATIDGGFAQLKETLRELEPDPKAGARAYAAQAMAKFTTLEHFRQPLVDHKAIEVLCDLLDEDNESVQVDAMKSLLELVAEDTNNLVTPAVEALPNLTRWIHMEHSSHLVGQHAACSLVAAIAARFDLREYIAAEEFLKELLELARFKLDELRQSVVFENETPVEVFFHQLTPKIRNVLKDRAEKDGQSAARKAKVRRGTVEGDDKHIERLPGTLRTTTSEDAQHARRNLPTQIRSSFLGSAYDGGASAADQMESHSSS